MKTLGVFNGYSEQLFDSIAEGKKINSLPVTRYSLLIFKGLIPVARTV